MTLYKRERVGEKKERFRNWKQITFVKISKLLLFYMFRPIFLQIRFAEILILVLDRKAQPNLSKTQRAF